MVQVKVIKRFKDRLSNMKIRKVGEIIEVSKDRCEVLLNSPLGTFVEELTPEDEIEFAEGDEEPSEEDGYAKKEYPFPKHTGGGWYSISNGEKIKGKEEAEIAESELRG